MKVDGACACGAIKVEAEADPEKTQVCHCTDCQTATGTAFRVSIPVAGATFKIIGKPAIYVKTTAESDRPHVGQRAWQTNPEHRAAQKLAREKYYTEYHIQVCTLDRESKFKLPEQAAAQP